MEYKFNHIPTGAEMEEYKTWKCHGFKVGSVTVKNPAASKRLNKEPDQYFTIFTDNLTSLESTQEAGECLVELLTPILAPYEGKRICVCGMGNEEIPPDSLGPTTVRNIPAKYLDLIDECKDGRFQKLMTLIPGVLMFTNMEPFDVITGVVSASKPDCLVLVDSISCTHFESLCRSIQVSTAGGMAHYLSQKVFDLDTLGIPVISIGVPTVIKLEHLKPGIHIPEDSLINELYSAPYMRDVIGITSAIIAYALIRIAYPLFTQQQCVEAVWLTRWANYLW